MNATTSPNDSQRQGKPEGGEQSEVPSVFGALLVLLRHRRLLLSTPIVASLLAMGVSLLVRQYTAEARFVPEAPEVQA